MRTSEAPRTLVPIVHVEVDDVSREMVVSRIRCSCERHGRCFYLPSPALVAVKTNGENESPLRNSGVTISLARLEAVAIARMLVLLLSQRIGRPPTVSSHDWNLVF